jgi:hypothetical protein
MDLKKYFAITKTKALLTIILTLIAEAIVYYYGATSSTLMCIIAPCPQPNNGPLYVAITLIPVLIVWFLFSSAIINIKENGGPGTYIKKNRGLSWIYLLMLFPFAYFYTRGVRTHFGLFDIMTRGCPSSSTCTINWSPDAVYAIIANIFVSIAIFALIALVLELFRRKEEIIKQ